jgi:hypothetical protein
MEFHSFGLGHSVAPFLWHVSGLQHPLRASQERSFRDLLWTEIWAVRIKKLASSERQLYKKTGEQSSKD